MIPVYTVDVLSNKSFIEVKAIARQLGAVPTADLRKRSNWAESILNSQAVNIQRVADELVAEITADIDAVADAAQMAVYANDSESHRSFDEWMAESLELLVNVQAKINSQLEDVQGQMNLLRGAIARIDAVIEPDIWWYDNTKGTVTIDGEKRQFQILRLYGSPIVQVLSTKGDWIDSRWHTARNNRYINAVLSAIPQHISDIHERILNSSIEGGDNEIWDGDDSICYEDQQPPGRGDGRGGRIECQADEWDKF